MAEERLFFFNFIVLHSIHFFLAQVIKKRLQTPLEVGGDGGGVGGGSDSPPRSKVREEGWSW